MSRLNEDELIATLFAPIAGPGGLGLRDDAALIHPEPGFDQVVTVDALVAGVHFFSDDSPGSIATKALAVNMSDLAAKGATPLGFVLALALPNQEDLEWLQPFAEGLGRAAALFECPLLGGDTVGTPGPLTLSITAFGSVPAGRMVRRTGARPGDELYVSGTIGDAALGLQLRLRDVRQSAAPMWERSIDATARLALIDRYLHPRPALKLRAALLDHAGGAMDVSDGLVGDVTKMLGASGVTGSIDLARVPLSSGARAAIAADPSAFTTVVTGGDDYEVLAAVPAPAVRLFEAAAERAGVAVTAIGQVSEGRAPPQFRDARGQPVMFPRGSFSHF